MRKPENVVTDFASSAMVAIMCEGMRRLGLRLPPVGRSADARVPLAFKREVLGDCLRQGGWRSLPRLGAGIAVIRRQPLHRALVASQTPGEFLARWMRMERYLHSRHRIDITPTRSGHVVMHCSRDGDPQPRAEESLLVLGVLAAAMAECGFDSVSVRIGRQPVYPDADEAQLRRLAERGRVGLWTLTAGTLASRSVSAGDDDIDGYADDAQSVQRLRQHLLGDLLAPPSLAEAAGLLRTSTRSLQRRLAQQGLSYSELVARLRCEVAGSQLIHGDASVAEIGFLCGFSDQAHFSRSFRRRWAVPPASFRAQFRA